MADYCTATDMELIYGPKNIKRWADLDNDEVAATIAARKAWACELATEFVNSRLLNGPYEIPFTSVPTMIVNLTAMYAGILLYDGRQVVSSEEPHDQVSRQRKDFDRYLRQIFKGQLKLLDPTSGDQLTITSKNYPFTVADDGTVSSSSDADDACPECC